MQNRSPLWYVLGALAILVVWWASVLKKERAASAGDQAAPIAGAPRETAAAKSSTSPAAAAPDPLPESDEPPFEGIEHLNAADRTVRQDLALLNEVFMSWQTNFPRQGNPVGSNEEITAALAGRNPLRYALIPRNHPAINRNRELTDRWGTPFDFHQLSGTKMEIRSAGPDRKLYTADDTVLTP